MMEYAQSLTIWMAIKSIMQSIGERRAPVKTTTSQQVEVFVPFQLPAAKPQPLAEAQPAVAVPTSSSEAMPVGV